MTLFSLFTVQYYGDITRSLVTQPFGRIELYIGLEIDYLNEASNPSIARFRELPLDYRIGSVHLLYNDKGEVVDVDVPADTFKTIVDGHFCGDLEHVVRLYYGRLTRMLELGGFDIVGHADKMHYNAACYRPAWYCAYASPRSAAPSSVRSAACTSSSGMIEH